MNLLSRFWVNGLGVLGAGALFCTITSNAHAADPTGLEVGARLGYGIPMGDGGKDRPMSDLVSGQIPIQLDLGYRVIPEVSVGLYLGYGFGMLASDVADACDATNADCSASTLRYGLQGSYIAGVGTGMDFWGGVGLGWESLTSSQSQDVVGTTVDVDSTISAFPELTLQAGLDFEATPNFGVGPFVSFAFATYSTGSVTVDGDETSGDIDDDQQAGHQWLTIGVRGVFLP